MKEKYEDLILRVVSKHYPYVKRIDFLVGRDQSNLGEGVNEMIMDKQHCDDLTVIVHIDTNMLSPLSKDVSEPEDYVHNLFNYPYGKLIRDDSYRLDKLIYTLTTPFAKLLPTNDDDPFMPEPFTQYLKYDIMS
jgi:hypothetical protein